MNEQNQPETPSEPEEQTNVRGSLNMSFLSDGTIKYDANGIVGMMDLWAASHLLQVKGDEVYVMGMRMLKEQLDAADRRDPVKRLVMATELPESKASAGNN
jgi:hypothetical protein